MFTSFNVSQVMDQNDNVLILVSRFKNLLHLFAVFMFGICKQFSHFHIVPYPDGTFLLGEGITLEGSIGMCHPQGHLFQAFFFASEIACLKPLFSSSRAHF